MVSGAGFVAAILAVVLLTGGCGTADSSVDGAGGASPDAPVSNTPGNEPSDKGGAQRVEPHDDVIDVHATVWDRHKVRAGGRAIDLYFWSGVEECYGVDHVEVVYGKRKITATIYEGREPTADACIELAVRKVIRVELEEALRGRAVEDGNPQG